MNVERHDLHHDFPEFKEKIHALKVGNAHFSRLFDEYHVATGEVEKLERQDIPVDDVTIEVLKKQRVKLKDELYEMLCAA